MHPLAIYMLLFPLAANADMYKCVDNTGKVTYTNSSCTKAGLKEAKVIPPPPPPAVDAASKAAQPTKTAGNKTDNNKAAEPTAKPKQTAALQVMKSMQSNSNACGKLNGDMGRIMDEMDSSRSQGGNADKQAAWAEKLNQLQAEKRQLGCF
jgi:hypothetical protein